MMQNTIKNPFASRQNVSTTASSGGFSGRFSGLIHPAHPMSPSANDLDDRQTEILESVKEFIVASAHPCVGAQASMRRDEFWLGGYGTMGSAIGTQSLAYDLFLFIQEQLVAPTQYASFMAVFDQETLMSEIEFENKLWRQLEELHLLSNPHFEWDKSVSSNPEDAKFSFSFAGNAFYIVGMHQGSSRMARQFKYPTLVFNLHKQFEELRASGQYDRVRDTIRTRDKKLQGDNNPMLNDFGTTSEAKQYSGRKVDSAWKCPFHHGAAASESTNVNSAAAEDLVDSKPESHQ